MSGPNKNLPPAKQRALWKQIDFTKVRPEDSGQVNHYKIRPPKDEKFIILGEVSVSKDWTDQSYIQCNICNRKNQFKNEGYIASFIDGWWYVVGPDCGDETFQKSFVLKMNEYSQERILEIANKTVSSFIENYKVNRQIEQSNEKYIKGIFEFRNLVKSRFPTLHSQLVNATKTGGELKITKVSQYSVREKKFYNIKLVEMFETPFGLIDQIKKNQKDLCSQFEFRFIPSQFQCPVLESRNMASFSKLINDRKSNFEQLDDFKTRVKKSLFVDFQKIGEWARRNNILDFDPFKVKGNSIMVFPKNGRLDAGATTFVLNDYLERK